LIAFSTSGCSNIGGTAKSSSELRHNFSYGFAADVSTGDTELTWSAGPAIGYTFGDHDQYRVTAGYRRMDIDFETADPVEAELSMDGLLVGFRVDF
jgi:hypothetical protein